jgi:hypothetical protein
MRIIKNSYIFNFNEKVYNISCQNSTHAYSAFSSIGLGLHDRLFAFFQ